MQCFGSFSKGDGDGEDTPASRRDPSSRRQQKSLSRTGSTPGPITIPPRPSNPLAPSFASSSASSRRSPAYRSPSSMPSPAGAKGSPTRGSVPGTRSASGTPSALGTRPALVVPGLSPGSRSTSGTPSGKNEGGSGMGEKGSPTKALSPGMRTASGRSGGESGRKGARGQLEASPGGSKEGKSSEGRTKEGRLAGKKEGSSPGGKDARGAGAKAGVVSGEKGAARLEKRDGLGASSKEKRPAGEKGRLASSSSSSPSTLSTFSEASPGSASSIDGCNPSSQPKASKGRALIGGASARAEAPRDAKPDAAGKASLAGIGEACGAPARDAKRGPERIASQAVTASAGSTVASGNGGSREGEAKVAQEPQEQDPTKSKLGVAFSDGSSSSNSSSGTEERDIVSEPTGPKAKDATTSNHLVSFSFRQIELATNNFDEDHLLGEGGFGPVFEGLVPGHLIKGKLPSNCLPSGHVPVAVKLLKAGSNQGDREWLAEVSYLGQHIHPHLVRLLGYCNEGEQRALVYELMPQGSLEFFLFAPAAAAEANGDPVLLEEMGLDPDEIRVLTWHERMRVAVGAAKGLAYLHEEAEKQVIYRDFKTSNILLDDNFEAKLSDFGLARDGPEGDRSHVSTRVVGTAGYAAPEYIMTGHLTLKSDVWAFGVVLLELLTGRLALDKSKPRDEQNLVEFAEPYLEDPRRLYRIMDPMLRGQYSVRGAQMAAAVAKSCLQKRAKQRPKMSAIVAQLTPVLDLMDLAGIEITAMGGGMGPMGYVQGGELSRKGGPSPEAAKEGEGLAAAPLTVAAAGRV